MDAPLVWRGELLDNFPLDEGGEGLFKDGSCSSGPHRGPLFFERDRRGGIVVGLVGHERVDLWIVELGKLSRRPYDAAEPRARFK